MKKEAPTVSYVICTTPRSGSSFFCEILKGTRALGKPDEYFLCWYRLAMEPNRFKAAITRPWNIPWLLPPSSYLAKVFNEGSTQNGVLGVKVMWSYFDVVLDVLGALPENEGVRRDQLLATALPNLRYIFLTRRNKVQQAVSLMRAIESGEWRSDWWMGLIHRWITVTGDLAAGRAPTKSKPLEYNFDRIAALYQMLFDQEAAWEAFFEQAGVQPYRVTYEEFNSAPERITVDIAGYLGIPATEALTFQQSPLKRQRDAISGDWSQRFSHELASGASGAGTCSLGPSPRRASLGHGG